MAALDDPSAFLGGIRKAAEQLKAAHITDTIDAKPSDDGEGSDVPHPAKLNPTGPSKDREAAGDHARSHQFPAPQAYDYSTFQQQEVTPEAGPRRIEPDWLSNAARYEWNDDFGDVPPRIEALEKELFQENYYVNQGNAMDKLQIKVTVEGPIDVRPIRDFADAGLHPVMLENLKLCHFYKPTPIQCYTLPAVYLGSDVVACSQTGSGKTGAYFIPILSKLMGKYRKIAAPRPGVHGCKEQTVRAEPLVLVVVPTRELATQVFDQARRLCYRTMLRPCVAYGGGPIANQRFELQKGCDVLIATPGRLLDFLRNSHVLSLRRLKYTILDEADELLQADWSDEIEKIMAGGDTNEDDDHIYMMFSATFNKELRRIAKEFMSADFVRIRVGRFGSTHKNITQQIAYVDENRKREALYDLLFTVPPARTLIFVNSKAKADLVDDYLFNLQLPSTSIHSDRTQREREDALTAFRTGRAPILVTTGVSARGLDVRNVMHVVNYDLPTKEHGGIDEYVHRIGRTARIGNEGLATSFYNDRDEPMAEDLVKILLECGQPVPDFLTHLIPENNKITWDDDTDDEDVENKPKDKNDSADAPAPGAAFAEDNGAFGDAPGGGFSEDPESGW